MSNETKPPITRTCQKCSADMAPDVVYCGKCGHDSRERMSRPDDFTIPKVARPIVSPMITELGRQYEVLTTWHIWAVGAAWGSLGMGLTFGRIMFLGVSAALISMSVISGNKFSVRRGIVKEGRDVEEVIKADDKRFSTWAWVIPFIAFLVGLFFDQVARRTFLLDPQHGY